MRWGRIPSLIHHLDNALDAATASEANGAPLSVRMQSGKPYSRNAHSITAGPLGGRVRERLALQQVA